jgi:hypothetical protein
MMLGSPAYPSAPLAVHASAHTMGASLLRYLRLKIHPGILAGTAGPLTVIGSYDRSGGISDEEKPGKRFNFKRPTLFPSLTGFELRCFPGQDYVVHFSNVVASYWVNTGPPRMVTHLIPTDEICFQALRRSFPNEFPTVQTVIMGYVEGLQFLSADEIWRGEGDFLWKLCLLPSGSAALLGCKHTYWGEIAGRIVKLLAERGVKRVIYSGKLGTLNAACVPNTSLATGSASILPDGRIVRWENLFRRVNAQEVFQGLHITVPSVLQETTSWKNALDPEVTFVDPEIGHMASAAQQSNIQFSYLHIVSDNLSRQFPYDLSNERLEKVLTDRTRSYRLIGDSIMASA